MAHALTKQAAVKGWEARKIAERWDVTPRAISIMAARATQRDIDAFNGLPDITAKP